MIKYESIQRHTLKKLKIENDLLKMLELIDQPFFQIDLYKFFKKDLALKNSSLSSHYFRNNFGIIIKTVCKSNEDLFTQNKNRTNLFVNHCCFNLLSLFCCETFYFSRETFYFSVRLLFFRESFYFFERLFLF